MNNKDYIPDPKLHRNISIIKSVLRIVAGICLVYGSIAAAGVGFIGAEILGIVEELV